MKIKVVKPFNDKLDGFKRRSVDDIIECPDKVAMERIKEHFAEEVKETPKTKAAQ